MRPQAIATSRPTFSMTMPSPAGLLGTGQAITVAESMRAQGWAVTAVALHGGHQSPTGIDLRTVNLSALEMLAPFSPLRFREDWLLNLGYEAFDWLAQRRLPKSDVFYGLSQSCLHSLRRARRLGAMTVLCACNTFMPAMKALVDTQYELLGEEHPLINDAAVRRVLAEYSEADLIRTESTLVRQSLIEGGIPDDKIFLIPPSIDLTAFKPPVRPPGEFLVAFVGGFSIRKGLHILLDAWEQLPHGENRLLLHGGGGGWAKRLLAPYRRRADVEFRTGSPHRTYAEASVCVVPSVEDGFCRVVAEAMACGVPVIVTERVGAKDLVTDGVEGFIVPAGDASGIAERILHLEQHPAERERMGRAASLRAQQCSIENEGRRLDSILAKALAGGEGRVV